MKSLAPLFMLIAYSATAQVTNCVLAPGLVGWWRADGNTIDAVQGIQGTMIGAVGFAAGTSGQAFRFNGQNSYVEVPDSPALTLTNELTIEFWVQRQRLGPVEYLLNKGGDITLQDKNYGVAIHSSAYGNQLHFATGSRWWGAGSVGDTNWHHCAVTVRSGDMLPTFYIDGIQRPVTQGEGGPDPIVLTRSEKALQIGAQVDPSTGWNYFSNTLLDEMSIYNRVLSAEEIREVFLAGAAGKCGAECSRRAVAAPVVVNGFVVGVDIVDRGCGYTNVPVVLINGVGTGAQAVATVTNGYISAITVLNAGSGYTTPPEIAIASPGFKARLAIAVSKVKVTLYLVLGRTYILESSPDMKNWTPLESQLFASSEQMEFEFDVANAARFFRIQESPGF